MNIPEEYKDIRPFTPEELPGEFEALLADEEFQAVLSYIYKGVPLEALRQQMMECTTNLDFQKKMIYPVLTMLLKQCSAGFSLDASALPDRSHGYTFISNHRDIVLDSAILSLLLLDNGFPTTVEIAIGDNLLIRPWIKRLVRINKSFIVQRSLSLRQMLESSKRMSGYMHFAIAEKNENIWIAQREGRAKDSDDRTQEAVLKMMAMGGEGTVAERLKSLHIVPLAISYEYDPCDYLKAKEFQQKRDNPDHKKSQADDLLNMQTGIFGKKGRIRYVAAPCIDQWLDEVANLPNAELFKAIAERIDNCIHRGYVLFPINYVAADLLSGANEFANHYTAEEKQTAEAYFAERLSLIDLPEKDEAFLRACILKMYANPVINQQAQA